MRSTSSRLKESAAEANVTERTLIIPRDVEIEVGWEVDLNAQNCQGRCSRQGSAPNYHYVGLAEIEERWAARLPDHDRSRDANEQETGAWKRKLV
jgi:hypothetical protein